MKQCPCGHVFDDSNPTVRVRFDINEERHVRCPACKAYTFEDLLTLAPKGITTLQIDGGTIELKEPTDG